MKFILKIIIILFFTSSLFSQNYTISGYVQEASNGENLIGVSVYDKLSNKGTSTNQYGFYSITLPKGKYNIVMSYTFAPNIAEFSPLRFNHKYTSDKILG